MINGLIAIGYKDLWDDYDTVDPLSLLKDIPTIGVLDFIVERQNEVLFAFSDIEAHMKRIYEMRCYLDDMCYDMLKIGNNCIISYGVFFACHGRNQGHLPITIEDGVYIGMRANIISKTSEGNGLTIGGNAVIGACTLVNKNIPAGATAVGVPCRIIEHGNA